MENTFLNSEISLFIHDDEHPELKKGCPALFLESRGELSLFEEPTRFLRTHFVQCGATPSPHTWHTASYGLKSWFQFLQALERDWQSASEQDRLDFRDIYLQSISPKTGKPYGASGVSRSMSIVRTFYEDCARRGVYHGDISCSTFAEERKIPLDRDEFADIRLPSRKVKDRALPKVRPGVKIHPFTPGELKSLLNYLGPQASDLDHDQRSARNRLACDLGWAVGLRVDEINALTTLQFMTLVPDGTELFTGMPLTILGKGKKTRQVIIPAWLVIDVLAYIECERAKAIKARKTRDTRPTNRLFVGLESSRDAGMPITNAALQKMIREACLALRLVTVIEKTVPETGERYLYKTPRHSMHDLRHTYAVLTYHAERLNGNPEPWKKIQAQLGHSRLQTTINIYLAHVEIFTDLPGLLDARKMLGL